VLQKLAQPLVAQPSASNELPLVPIVVLALAVLLGAVAVWYRVRLGIQLDRAAGERAPSLIMPESLPSRYAVADPAGGVVAGLLGLIDLALLLLLQNTVRGPLLALAEHYNVVPRTLAEAAFVSLIVVIALVLLVKTWRASGPVLVLVMWWGMDRVVPTAGFVGARPALATAAPSRASEATVTAPQTTTDDEATLLAQPTVMSLRRANQDEDATLLSPSDSA